MMLGGSGSLLSPKMRLRRASKSGSLNFFGATDLGGGDKTATTLPFLTISTCWPSATQSMTLPKAWRSCLTLAVFMYNNHVILHLPIVNFKNGPACAVK